METRDEQPSPVRYSAGSPPQGDYVPPPTPTRQTTAPGDNAALRRQAATSRFKLSMPVPLWSVPTAAVLALAAGLIMGRTTASAPAAASPPTVTLDPALEDPTTAEASQASAPVVKTVVLRQSGNGDKTTQAFTTSGVWSVAYTYNCSNNYDGTGLFAVDDIGADGDTVADTQGTKGADTSYQYGDGAHALKIISECKWTLTVTDGDNG